MGRKRFTFWLDDKKPTEADIAETIPALKSQRSFAKTIRDGIRLIVDLRNGNTDVLFELFPLLKAKLQADFGGNGGNGLTEDKIRAIVWEATNDPTSGIQMKSLPSGNGSHENNVLPVPSFDGLFDDGFKPMSAAEREADLKKREAEREKVVVQDAKGTDKAHEVSMNFLNMIGSMQAGEGGW